MRANVGKQPGQPMTTHIAAMFLLATNLATNCFDHGDVDRLNKQLLVPGWSHEIDSRNVDSRQIDECPSLSAAEHVLASEAFVCRLDRLPCLSRAGKKLAEMWLCCYHSD